MAGFKQDGNFALEGRIQKTVVSQPIPGVNIDYVAKVTIRQFADNYAAPNQNSPHPDSSYSSFKFQEDSERQNLGGGIVQWTRTYVKTPASHDVWESYALNIIGLYGQTGVNVPQVIGRDRRVLVVTSRLAHDYFLTGNGGDYATPGDIPLSRAFQFAGGNGILNQGNLNYPIDYLDPYTVPTYPYYQTMMATARAKGWKSDVTNQLIVNSTGVITLLPTPPTGGQYAVEDSKLTQWIGNIYVRTTRYVLAV